MVLPPSEAGAVQTSVTWVFAGDAELRIGAPGAVGAADGVAFSAFDGAPVPAAFVAVTVNEYVVPLVRPLTGHVWAPLVVHVAPPGLAVAVYPVIVLPPFEAGADQASVT